MKVGFGKHSDREISWVVVKMPDYVVWMNSEKRKGEGLARALAEAKRLIQRFDSKPFVKKCCSCQEAATNCSVYLENVQPMWWCDNCDPYSRGAEYGKLQFIRRYSDALSHVELFCRGRRQDYRELVGHLAKGKGLSRVTSAGLKKLFG